MHCLRQRLCTHVTQKSPTHIPKEPYAHPKRALHISLKSPTQHCARYAFVHCLRQGRYKYHSKEPFIWPKRALHLTQKSPAHDPKEFDVSSLIMWVAAYDPKEPCILYLTHNVYDPKEPCILRKRALHLTQKSPAHDPKEPCILYHYS